MQHSNKRSVRARRVAAGSTRPANSRREPAKRQNYETHVLAAHSALGRDDGRGASTTLAPETIDVPAPWPDQVETTTGAAPENTRGVAAWGRDTLRAAGQRIRQLTLEQWLWIAVIGLAAVLRFWGLGDKPLHHDESMHAYFSLAFAQNPSSYSYDPLLHGPFQFHAEGLMFALLLVLQHIFVPNAIGNPWINDTTARFVPALFGMGIVALPLLLRRQLGRTTALLAAFLLAISPAFVYFARFLREDVYFNFFMFAMVVCAVRFAKERTMKWFVLLCAATVLAYATFEGIFLTLVIFFGFLALLAVWELAASVARKLPASFTSRERMLLSRLGLFALAGACAAIVAYFGLKLVNAISTEIYLHTATTDVQVAQLENTTVSLLLIASILIALGVIATLVWQIYRDAAPDLATAPPAPQEWLDDDEDDAGNAFDAPPATSVAARIDALVSAPGRFIARVRDRLDPDAQPFLRLLLSISWMQWFVGFVVGWILFAALYWIVPGTTVQSWGEGFRIGIGKGIWQGLYYWLEQQQVARGGQPWYYYLLLIPLYEQLAVVFGLAGVVYCLFRPSRFRLFLVWWFLASLFIYSWAAEKMPWLSIHILLPLMLLAAIALGRVVAGVVAASKRLAQGESGAAVFVRPLVAVVRASATLAVVAITALGNRVLTRHDERLSESRPILRRIAGEQYQIIRTSSLRPLAAVLSAVLALLLVIPTVWGMYELSHPDAASGPNEMMVYVQTTPDVTHVMREIAYADQVLYHGQHKLKIGVGTGQEWPWYWYLRDYTNVYWSYPVTSKTAPPVDVLILDPSGNQQAEDGQTFMALHPTGWQMKEYRLRAWWSEDYKPQPCTATPGQPCPASSSWGWGVGLGNYLTYGSYPPQTGAHFQLGLATGRVWTWLWTRQPLGDPHGSTDFVFIVHDGLPIHP
jgi:uncharacterized protein (TIGR03663 family)